MPIRHSLQIGMLLGCMLLFTPVHAKFFSDVVTGDADLQVIENAAVNQLMEGFPDGAFKPEAPVRRAEEILVRARLLRVSLRGFMILPKNTVSDPQVGSIPAHHWAYAAASFLAEHGLLAQNTTDPSALAGELTRGEFLANVSTMMQGGIQRNPEQAVAYFSERCLLPAGWGEALGSPVTRREMARWLDDILYYMTQHAMTEGTITAFEIDEQGNRWVHLETLIGEARLCLPTRGVLVQGIADDNLSEGMRIRTVSDAVCGASGAPYYRVREVTVIPSTAKR